MSDNQETFWIIRKIIICFGFICSRIKKIFEAIRGTKPEEVSVWGVQELDIVENNELGTDLLSHTAYIVMVMNCPRLKN